MSGNVDNAVQELYRTAAQTRTQFGGNLNDATSYYADLVNFINRVSPSQEDGEQKKLLDVGCGCGWSSFCFAKAGYRTTGIDLNLCAFEPPATQNLSLLEGSALALPFEDRSFDVITSYQCIEHIPNPEAALNEMIRVCKPNGMICIVGPNLVSPFLPVKFLLKGAINGNLIVKRHPTTPLHPYGNTASEHLSSLVSTTGLLLQKLLNSKSSFSMRVPDTVPPFHGDNDACYLCNPTDLVRFFQKNHFQILRKGRHGRPPMSYLFAGGTWVVAQRREATLNNHQQS